MAMNVEITGRHVVITSAIRSFVMKRLRKFDKLCGENASFHVIIDVEKERHSAEILLKSKLLGLTGKGETDDMYASIQLAIEKLERQAIKSKSRLIEGKRQKAKAKAVEKKTGSRRMHALARADQSYEILEEESPRRAMAVEEAAAELGESEYPFVVFKNIESGSMNILYRRKDGSLGLIQE
jgi:putative sigma-54 modulation protein